MSSNVQKMREALLRASQVLETCGWLEGKKSSTVKSAISEIRDSMDIPLRNCDVGKAEEQLGRWRAFCAKYDCYCTNCPCDGRTDTLAYCFAKWSQIPYESEEK